MNLTPIYPCVEIATWPILVEGIAALCPPEVLGDFKVFLDVLIHRELFSVRADQAAVGALADGLPRHEFAVEHRL